LIATTIIENNSAMAAMSIILLPRMDGTRLLFEPLLAALPDFMTPIVVRYPGNLTYGCAH
jgi:hypothetical protein